MVQQFRELMFFSSSALASECRLVSIYRKFYFEPLKWITGREHFHVISLFRFRLNDTAVHTSEAFGLSFVFLHIVERWFQNFRAGDFGIKDAPREGRPTAIRVGEMSII